MTLWEILKANKTGIAPDMFTMLAASKMNGGRDRLHELSGIPPLSFTAKGKPLTAWSITGNTVQNGTPTPENPVEVQSVGDYDSETGLYRIPIVTRGKNLLKLKEVNLTVKGVTISIKNNSITVKGTGKASGGRATYLSGNFVLQPGTYFISGDIVNGMFYCLTDISNGKAVIASSTSKFTLTEKTKVAFGLNFINGVSYDATVSVMLNEGNKILPYEPYHEPITTPIYLDSPLYKIGNYADRLSSTEEVRVVKELVLTGKENWYYMPNYDVENTVRIYSLGILTDRKGTMLDLCSHFERMDYHSLNVSNKPAFSIASGTQLIFRVSKAEGSAVTYFKSYLADQYAAGTPVKVYYVMQTPETKTVEPVEIPTLNGTTVIDVDTAVKPESMTIKYRR